MAGGELPSDVDAASFCRLPLPDRDQLDDRGKAAYDALADPNSKSRVGLQGPGTIQLHSPRVSEHSSGLNKYLRGEAGFDGAILELSILVAAREMDSRFEWAAHEPAALEEGLDAKIIDVVRNKKSTAGLPETESLIIEFGRQLFREKKVSPDKFAAALALFGEKGIVEFVVLMGQYAATALLLAAVDMQPKPGLQDNLPVD
ncbi:MAG: hypothetical protein HQ503_13010 [Rhodospirillales bacterium]|nr:hypothetical protein [Rhodospirillales bacterium]